MPNYRYNPPDSMMRGRQGYNSMQTTRPGCSGAQTSRHRSEQMHMHMDESMHEHSHCCDDRTDYDELSGMPLGMAYVPWQDWCALYEAEKGFQCGTIFEKLNKPFMGAGGVLR